MSDLDEQQYQNVVRQMKSEWKCLQELVKAFSERRTVGPYTFEWFPNLGTSENFLQLNSVAAGFEHLREGNPMPTCCKLRFHQNAISGTPSENSPIPPEEWSLRPSPEGGTFKWALDKVGETFSSDDLVKHIVSELAKYHEAYEKALKEEDHIAEHKPCDDWRDI